MATQAPMAPSHHGTSDPIAAGMMRDGVLNLRASRPLVELLAQLSVKMDMPVADVLAGAVLLLDVAVDAQDKGQRMCLTDHDGKIVGEVLDLIQSGGADIDPFSEADPDRINP